MKKLLIIAIAMVTGITAFAQNGKPVKADSAIAAVKYICPMHADVTSDKPGKCSKCGMDLVKIKKEKIKSYSCPMHPEVTSDKHGKCSKCGMALVKTKTKS
jgi:hypothetical protein